MERLQVICELKQILKLDKNLTRLEIILINGELERLREKLEEEEQDYLDSLEYMDDW